ncbi:ABC transporter ATP-binding protein [Dactylosporangium sp. NBC_01737]|uniref:ABC transporter ATP-binding protein n=1 Tax=Dactylosporangium sp. NBC_01737 TaxID=2975959 RepID=UPI002E0D2E97|nr:ABC transporter ATP-binding protein [Dactylosporangium sp. NBC_01737]
MTPAIQVHGLRRRYGTFEAVRDVSFDVERGELFALLGTNGAGKTSTLELVEGLDRPTAGTVRVLGHDPVRDRAVVRPRTGVMLQEGGFPPDLTPAEALRMWAGTLPAHATRPVAEALDLVDLTHRAAVRIRQLSGGERRRLDLAAAVIGRPDLLILDEPTTGLDPQSRNDTWLLLRRLLGDGVTILLSTHYLQEAQELADRVAILHGGSVVATGSVAEVVAGFPARIAFDLPAGLSLDALPDVVGAYSEDGGRVTVHTTGLQAALTTLLNWAAAQGIALDGLDARSASLDEAFLSIAGGAS